MLQRFDDIFAEILQALDLRGLLLERLIEPRVFDGDGHVAGDRGEQLEVFAREVIAVDRLAQAEHGDRAVAEAAGDEIVQVELLERAADRIGFLAAARADSKKRQPRRERRPRRVEKAQIERAFGAHVPSSATSTNWPGCAGILEEDGEAVDEQRLRNAVEHGAEQRLEADFVGERAAEFDQRAAIVEAVAIEEVVEARLHPVAQRLEQERGDDDGDHRAGRARRPGRVEQLADQRDAAK